MSDEPIAPYVSEGIDAGQELAALSDDVARYFLVFMQTIVAGKREYEEDSVFDTYLEEPVFKAQYRGSFIIYVVEKEDDGGVRVTLISAGRMADFARDEERAEVWDTGAVAAVKAHIAPRLEDFFG